MTAVERGQSEMVNFAINLNRRKADNDISSVAYTLGDYDLFEVKIVA